LQLTFPGLDDSILPGLYSGDAIGTECPGDKMVRIESKNTIEDPL